MRIPKSFQIGGRTIRVKYDHGIKKEGNFEDRAIPRKSLIIIDKDPDKVNDYQALTFTHELVHLCIDAIGKYELSRDEEFVETFSNFLHQALTTMKY